MGVIDVVNPATGAVVGSVADMPADDVRKVVDLARQAQPSWQVTPLKARLQLLRQTRRAMVARREEIRDVLIAESGKPWEDAQADLVLVWSIMAHWEGNAAAALADVSLPTPGMFGIGRSAVEVFHPHGVVGAIGPWNFPLGLTFGDAIAALIAGNTVVLKPSEVTPLSNQWAVEVMAEQARKLGLPEDLMGIVTGTGAAGAALVDEVDMVQFTGSVGTGRRIAHACIDRDIPYSLELGGKDPWVILADADIERVAAAATHYGLFNGGQVCMSAERIYVEASVHDEFVDALASRVATLRTVPGAGIGTTDVAPLVGPGQASIVAAHIADALDKGAVAVTGGLPRDDGQPLPTVLTGVDHSMTCMVEETFGPTIPVMAVADADQAVALANDTTFGLTASVWTRDTAAGQDLARRINAGTVNVNDANLHAALGHLPMGGIGASGTGARNGLHGIRKFTRSSVVLTNRSPIRRELTWMPYQKLSSRLVDRALGLKFGR